MPEYVMKKQIYIVALLLLTSGTSGCSAPDPGEDCRSMTPELKQMTVKNIRLRGPGGRHIELKPRVADDRRELAAGFQHICPETAEHISILFEFRAPYIPKFHMRNVHMPLDIAFIDEQGVIRNIQTLQPYAQSTIDAKKWSPPIPVSAALEVKAGLFKRLGVTENEWSIVLKP